jgi:hypothetical protein
MTPSPVNNSDGGRIDVLASSVTAPVSATKSWKSVFYAGRGQS